MAVMAGKMKRFLVWLIGLTCAVLFGQGSEALGLRIQGEGKIKTPPPPEGKSRVTPPAITPAKPNPRPVPVKYGPPPIKPKPPERPNIMVKYGISPGPGPRR